MRIAIVDDLAAERTLMKERLVRQLGLRGAQAEILEFDSGEAFLAARQKQRFTAAFLDIYMPGRSGMDVARELRKKDADCILVFTTTSTDHALEGSVSVSGTVSFAASVSGSGTEGSCTVVSSCAGVGSAGCRVWLQAVVLKHNAVVSSSVRTE